MFERLIKTINEKRWANNSISTINSMFNDIESFVKKTWKDGSIEGVRIVLFYSRARIPMALRVLYKQKNSGTLVSFLKTPMGKVKAEATTKRRKDNVKTLKIFKTQNILSLSVDNETNKNYEAIIHE